MKAAYSLRTTKGYVRLWEVTINDEMYYISLSLNKTPSCLLSWLSKDFMASLLLKVIKYTTGSLRLHSQMVIFCGIKRTRSNIFL